MTEIQHYIPPTDSWVTVIEPVGDLASKIADTDFVPKEFRRKPAAVAAAILYGREIGLQPMSSLRSVNVIHGTPSLESEAMRALILSHGHHLRFVETTATRCIMEGCRRGSEEWTRVGYTMDEANQSGDAKKNPNYRSRPQEMMIARATSRLARMVFADVIGGLATPEEIDTTGEAPPPAPPQTVTVKHEKPKAVKSRSPHKAKTGLNRVAEPEQPEQTQPEQESTEPPLPGEDGYEDLGDDKPTPSAAPSPTPKDPEATKPTKRMLTALHAALNSAGLTDREDKLQFCADVVGRQISSSADLTRSEVGDCLDTLSASPSEPDVVDGEIVD